MSWDPVGQRLYLDDINSGNNWIGSTALGPGGGDLDNGICTVHGASSGVSSAGKSIQLNLKIDIAPQPGTSPTTYFLNTWAENQQGYYTGWTYNNANVTVSALTGSPVTVSGGVLTGPGASGAGGVYQFVATDSAGIPNLTYFYPYLSTTSTIPGSATTNCQISWFYASTANMSTIILSDGSWGSDGWSASTVLGSGGQDISLTGNPTCTVHGARSSASYSGNSVILNLAIDVSPGTWYMFSAAGGSAGYDNWPLLAWFTTP